MEKSTYRDLWQNAHKKTPVICLNLDLELSTHCNLKCSFCALSNPDYKVNPKFMDMNLCKKIIDKASRQFEIPALKLNWRGESTLHPNFNDIVEHAYSRSFCELLLNTNGHFDSNKIQPALMQINKVIFSIDSLNRKIYSQIRRGGNLGLVLYNLERLLRYGHEGISINRVICPANEDEPFALELKRLFGKKVKLNEHFVFPRIQEFVLPYSRIYCRQPSQRLIVSVDGKIFPCCVDYNETMELPNYDYDFKKIWKSFELCRLRFILKHLPSSLWYKTCKNCTSWSSYDCLKREKLMEKV